MKDKDWRKDRLTIPHECLAQSLYNSGWSRHIHCKSPTPACDPNNLKDAGAPPEKQITTTKQNCYLTHNLSIICLE